MICLRNMQQHMVLLILLMLLSVGFGAVFGWLGYQTLSRIAYMGTFLWAFYLLPLSLFLLLGKKRNDMNRHGTNIHEA